VDPAGDGGRAHLSGEHDAVGSLPAIRSRRTLEALGVGVLATLVSFPIRSTTPTQGLDASWQLGLSLAHTTGLRFGPELVFTYGPLGFLAAPSDVWLPGAVLGLVYVAVTSVALWGLLFACTRRWLSAWVAGGVVVLASLAAPRTSVPELGALALALLALDLLEPSRRRHVLPVVVPLLLGANAALQLLIKTSVGGFALGVALLVAVARPGWRRSLPIVLASWVGAIVVLWVGAGQHLGDLPDWAPWPGGACPRPGCCSSSSSGCSCGAPSASPATTWPRAGPRCCCWPPPRGSS
jgi:hypothetical protein